MKIWFSKSPAITKFFPDNKESFFLFQYNRWENGYGEIYFRLWRFHLLIYTYKIVGKMKEGIRKHKTIKL